MLWFGRVGIPYGIVLRTYTYCLGETMTNQLKPLPAFASEEEERAFWEGQDSSEYVDWGHAERARFPNLKPTSRSKSLPPTAALHESSNALRKY